MSLYSGAGSTGCVTSWLETRVIEQGGSNTSLAYLGNLDLSPGQPATTAPAIQTRVPLEVPGLNLDLPPVGWSISTTLRNVAGEQIRSNFVPRS